MFKQTHAITTTIATLLFGSALTLSPAWAGDRDKTTEMPASEHQARVTEGVATDAEGAERVEGERSTDGRATSPHQEEVIEDVGELTSKRYYPR